MSEKRERSEDDEPEEGEIKDDGSLEEVSSNEEVFQDDESGGCSYIDYEKKRKSQDKHSKTSSSSRQKDNEEGTEKVRRPRQRPSLLRDFRFMRYRSSKEKALKENYGEKEIREFEDKANRRKGNPVKNYQSFVPESSESQDTPVNEPDGGDRQRESSPSSSKSCQKHKLNKIKYKRKKKNRRYSHDSESDTACNTDSAIDLDASKSTPESNEPEKYLFYGSCRIELQAVSPASSEVEILEVPPKIPEVITLDDSDDDDGGNGNDNDNGNDCKNEVGNACSNQQEDNSTRDTSSAPEHTQRTQTQMCEHCQRASLAYANATKNEQQKQHESAEENNNGEEANNDQGTSEGHTENEKHDEREELDVPKGQENGESHGQSVNEEEQVEDNQRNQGPHLGCDAEKIEESSSLNAQSDDSEKQGQEARSHLQDTSLSNHEYSYTPEWSNNEPVRENSAYSVSGTDDGSTSDCSFRQNENAAELLVSAEDSAGEGMDYGFVTEEKQTGKSDSDKKQYGENAVNRLCINREGGLEEDVLQLRLNALRSAMLRKHMERKQRGVTLTKRRRSSINSISPLTSPNHSIEETPCLPLSPPPEPPPLPPDSDWECESTFNLNEEANEIVDMDLVDTDEEKDRGLNNSMPETIQVSSVEEAKVWYPENVARKEIYPQDSVEPSPVPPLSPPPLPPFVEEYGLIMTEEFAEEKTEDNTINPEPPSEDANATPAFVDTVLYQENMELNVFSNNQKNGQIKDPLNANYSKEASTSTSRNEPLCMCERLNCTCQRAQASEKMSEERLPDLQSKELRLDQIFGSLENDGNCIEIDLNDMIVLDEIGRTSSDSEGKSAESVQQLQSQETCDKETSIVAESDESNGNSVAGSSVETYSDFETEDEVGTVDTSFEREMIRIIKETEKSSKINEKSTESNKDLGSDAGDEEDAVDNNDGDDEINALRVALLDMLENASTKTHSDSDSPVLITESPQKKSEKQEGTDSLCTELNLTSEGQTFCEDITGNVTNEGQNCIDEKQFPDMIPEKNDLANNSFPQCFNVPNLVINLGEDSDSGEEQTHENGGQVTEDFEQKLDQLLKQARSDQEVDQNEKEEEQVTLKNQSVGGNVAQNGKSGTTSKAVNTNNKVDGNPISEVRGSLIPSVSVVDIGVLPSFKQEEYLRLKQQLALKEREMKAKRSMAGSSNCVSKKGNMQRLLPVRNDDKIQIKVKKLTQTQQLEIPGQGRGAPKRIINNRKLIKRVPGQGQALHLTVGGRSTRIVTSPRSVGGIFVTAPNMLRNNSGHSYYRRVLSTGRQRIVTALQSPNFQKMNIQVTARNKLISGSENKLMVRSETVVSNGNHNGASQNVQDSNSTVSGQEDEKEEKTNSQLGGKRTLPPPESQIPKKIKILPAADAKNDLTESQLLDKLREYEADLISERYKVLEEVSSIRENLHEIEAVNFFRMHANAEIKRLEVALQQMKNYAIEKDRQLKILNGNVEKSKKLIMRSQSETMLKLLRCKEFGFQLHGDNYTAPTTGADTLNGKMKEISQALSDLRVGRSIKHSLQAKIPVNTNGKAGTSSQAVNLPPANQSAQPQPGASPDPRRTMQYSSPLDAMKHQECLPESPGCTGIMNPQL